jgi:hypothetical protein
MTRGKQEGSAVAVFDSHTAAGDAVKALERAGVDLKSLSIVGKDFQTEEHALGFYTAGDRMRFWGTRAFFFIPAIGPIVVMGPLVTWLVGALEGAAVGGAAGALAAAFGSIGIPNDSVVKYERAVKNGSYVVLVQGDIGAVEHARSILAGTGASLLATHTRDEFVTRDTILGLLSDEEVARVSNAEAAEALSVGDEYLDLEEIAQGVHCASGAPLPMGSVLPRRSVHANTWTRILARLPPGSPVPPARASTS